MASLSRINKLSVALFAFSMLSGCAQHTWVPGPGMSAANFEPAKAECSYIARHGGSDLVAYGRPSFVAGAALGHAIGESIRAQADFNDCMSAKGWRALTPETIASNKVKGASIRTAGEISVQCVAAIRAREVYAPIHPYFGDPKTGKHSMAQLAMSNYATPAEAQLLTAYFDEVQPCLDARQAEVEKVTPEGASVMREARAHAKAEALRVIKREQTWSTYFERADQAIDATSARLKTVHF